MVIFVYFGLINKMKGFGFYVKTIRFKHFKTNYKKKSYVRSLDQDKLYK